eukprot:FR738481.1.p1 GENE.FR738481.1~~FR738481.1.p1  ORF type:complete len:157 (+),score=9.43 FR738481.1:54-473(+)
MICGGTGITPMYQVISTALADPEDKTVFHLIYANQVPSGIMLQDELSALQKVHPERLSIEYVVDAMEGSQDGVMADATGRRYSVGYITEQIINQHICQAAGSQSKVELCFMCGPPPMIKYACLPNLRALGFTEEQMVEF